jgi:hypothetical protein
MNESSRVSRLRAKYEQEELERINRLTGLKFDTVPVSLLSQQDENNGLARVAARQCTQPLERRYAARSEQSRLE